MKTALVVAVATLGAPAAAEAFCGFYIDAGGSEMYNNATQVVLMRDGTRTVLSMQNNYQGPVRDFAMVVPVPTVLKQSDVRTLPRGIFDRVNKMSAPRLVEYWEEDPCNVWRPEGHAVDARSFSSYTRPDLYGVKIEAKFDVDEYQIVILSAKESTGLEKYLRAEKYKIPRDAAPLLQPHIVAGSKFFVAKVDPKKVKFEKGQAMLSPLRFHYDSDDFVLPIRLGLANSPGTQDLIINILSPGQRYDVANYPNAFIPTNIDVKDDVRNHFAAFYAALFDRTLQQNPRAVITEYAYSADACDPCPGFQLDSNDFALLGEEVLKPYEPPKPPPAPPAPPATTPAPSAPGFWPARPPTPPPDDEIEIEPEPDYDIELDLTEYRPGFVLTRLHARYGLRDATDDLVFRAAEPVRGGEERRTDGRLLTTAVPAASRNAFQARYVIRHPWTGPVTCEEPQRGVWGASPDGGGVRWAKPLGAATDTAFAARGTIELQNLVAQDIPAIAVTQGVPLSPPLPRPADRRVKARGCGCHGGDGAPGIAMLVMLVVAAAIARRK